MENGQHNHLASDASSESLTESVHNEKNSVKSHNVLRQGELPGSEDFGPGSLNGVVPGTPDADTPQAFPSSDPIPVSFPALPNPKGASQVPQAMTASGFVIGTSSAVGAIHVWKLSTLLQFMTPAPIRQSLLGVKDSMLPSSVTKVRIDYPCNECDTNTIGSWTLKLMNHWTLNNWNLTRKRHSWCSKLRGHIILPVGSSKNLPNLGAVRVLPSQICTSIRPRKQGGNWPVLSMTLAAFIIRCIPTVLSHQRRPAAHAS